MKIQHFEEITKANKEKKREGEIKQPKKNKNQEEGATHEKRSSHPQNLEERGCFTHPT